MRRLQYFGRVHAYLDNIECEGRLIVIEGTDGVGRSTHVTGLRRWLEIQGHAVIETGWTRSLLVGKTIDRAKAGHELSPLTFTLLYACDFADRLEREILPALRAGYIVLADRYIHTALARTVVRGVDPEWVRALFSFAPLPDRVLYLKIDATTLARRVIMTGGIDYWEAGKDRHPNLDIYESFMAYQGRLLDEFDRLGREFNFDTVDATRPIDIVQLALRRSVAEMLNITAPVDVALNPPPEELPAPTLGA